MSVERAYPLKLRSARGVALVLLYLAVGAGVEYALLYYGFLAPGLEDTYIWRLGLWTNIIPAFCTLVLAISWLHLTESFLVERRPSRRRPRGKRKRVRGFRAKLSRAFSRLSAPLSSAGERVQRRLGVFGTAVVKGLGVLILGLSVALMAAALLAYWPELDVLVGRLVRESRAFAWLISSLAGLASSIRSVQQLGWLASRLMDASAQMSRSLRPLALIIIEADPLYKFALAQNLLVWSSGLAALAYRRPPIRRR